MTFQIFLLFSHLVIFSTAQAAAKPSPLMSPKKNNGPAGVLRAEANQVWVGKSDQATSCNTNPGISLDAMATELAQAGIKSFDKQKFHDSQLHIQMCGADKGTMNVYLIEKTQLQKAVSLGFSEIKPGL